MFYLKRILCIVLLGGLVALAGAEVGFTQGPGGVKAKGQRASVFDRLSGGADSFDVNTVAIPPRMLRNGDTAEQRREQWLAFLTSKGVTDGKMTRDLFRDFVVQKTARPAANSDSSTAGTESDPKPKASVGDGMFKRLAKGGDSFDVDTVDIPRGMLRKGESVEKKRESWRAFLEENGVRNGVMTRNLFRDYVKQQSSPRVTIDLSPKPEKEEVTRRPTVYRAGKLPKGLPAWFQKLDVDRDGQVSLYEWKKGGQPVNDFVARDLNGDGFLTVEEVLRYEKAHPTKAATASTARANR